MVRPDRRFVAMDTTRYLNEDCGGLRACRVPLTELGLA